MIQSFIIFPTNSISQRIKYYLILQERVVWQISSKLKTFNEGNKFQNKLTK